MAIINKAGACVALATVLLTAGGAHAVSPADKCESSKLKTAGKYDFCRLLAEAKAAKTGSTPDFTTCDAAYSAKWTLAETKAGGICPSNGDEKTVQSFIIEHSDAIVALAAGTLPKGLLSCGAALAACLSRPRLLKTGQTIAYGTGSDGDLQTGDARSFTDNGDGTITDNTTGLMWEKKSRDDSIHDWSKTYKWSAPSIGQTDILMDGTMVTTFLATLNGGGFAGHTDWRIPNVNELLSIVNYQYHDPAVFNAFNTNCAAGCTVKTCSCTKSLVLSNPLLVLHYVRGRSVRGLGGGLRHRLRGRRRQVQ